MKLNIEGTTYDTKTAKQVAIFEVEGTDWNHAAQVFRAADGRLLVRHVVTTERLAEISEAEYEKLMKFAEAHPVYQTAYIASVFTRSDWKKAAQQGEDIVECANEFFKEQTA